MQLRGISISRAIQHVKSSVKSYVDWPYASRRFCAGRYLPPIRSAKSRGDVETGYNIHAVSRAPPDDNQLRSRVAVLEPLPRNTLKIFIDIIKNQHGPLTATKMSRHINKSRISILRHIPPVTRRSCASARRFLLRFSFASFAACKIQPAASRRACIVRPVPIRALNRSASRKGKASVREAAAAEFYAESKKLEKVDARLHENQVYPIPPYFVSEIANFLSN